MKTANEILLEHGINIMSFNDEFNSQLLNAMERYAEEKISDSDEEPDAIQYFHNHAVTFFGINAGSYLDEEYFMKYARWKASLKPNKLSNSEIETMAEAEWKEIIENGGYHSYDETLFSSGWKKGFIAGCKAIIELNKK